MKKHWKDRTELFSSQGQGRKQEILLEAVKLWLVALGLHFILIA